MNEINKNLAAHTFKGLGLNMLAYIYSQIHKYLSEFWGEEGVGGERGRGQEGEGDNPYNFGFFLGEWDKEMS